MGSNHVSRFRASGLSDGQTSRGGVVALKKPSSPGHDEVPYLKNPWRKYVGFVQISNDVSFGSDMGDSLRFPHKDQDSTNVPTPIKA